MKPKQQLVDQTETNPHAIERRYRGEQEYDMDLYKLSVAEDAKNANTPDDPIILKQPHSHIFRTYDSDGRPLSRSSAITGHFHEVKVIPQGKGKSPLLEIGPAVHEVRRRKGKSFVKAVERVDASGKEEDVMRQHTHTYEYVDSRRIALRKVNIEAVKVHTAEANKTAPIPGVQG